LCQLSFQSNQLRLQGFTASFLMVSTAVYRDPSAWYHIVCKVDTTQATAANRVRMYVNGAEITSWSTNTPPPQNTDTAVNNSVAHNIGRNTRNANDYFDGYLTEVNLIDGQALDPSSFGETDAVTGVWKPKKYAGTYGTNGFYLNFSDNSNNTATTIGKDYSGNGNNWTPNNISVTAGVTYDSMLDVPTQWADGGNGRGSYCVMSPLDGVSATLSNGNLQSQVGAGTTSINCSTFAVTSGKWYWEVSPSTISNNAMRVGIGDFSVDISSRVAASAGGWYYVSTGNKANSGSSVAYGASYTTSDVIGVALDMDSGTIEFYKNNTSQGVAYSTGLSGKLIGAALGSGTGVGAQAAAFNFGQRPFTYTPPTGFKALNTLNLPTPTILKGNQYFDATTYTGNGSTQSIVNAGGFQPDLVWTKMRGLSAGHNLVDAVRGATKALYSNLTNAETTDTNGVTAFNANGFALGSASGYNNNGVAAVGWQWKEGPTQGFDIVTYTGNGTSQNISHSLGVAPRMMIVKKRSTTGNWPVYHASLGNATSPFLNLTNAANSQPNVWNSTTPTSSVFTVGSDGETNASAATYVAYLFSEVAGYSKFGSYTGNGSADGPFVFCGFRPRFVMIKRTDSTSDWQIMDTARDTYNASVLALFPNLSAAEASGYNKDLLSNGFKLRDSGASINASGGTYIFAAFSESPFKNSLAR
jgi:hypothetical protein